MTHANAPPAYVRGPAAPFLNSLSVDRPLARYDIAGSVAHAEMLGRAGLLTPDETTALVHGLRTVAREVADGTFPWRDDLEDVHTNVEVRLTEIVGPVGGKLQTARSRNDQVAVDERLYLRATVRDLGERLRALEVALLARAEAELTTPIPGYTHLQRAQPVTVGHTLLAHFWRFDRDLDRLLATASRADVCPLGAGALAGTTLPTDPAWVAGRLGFSRPFDNSMDAVSDRDPLAELLFDLALLAVHASAFGEEIVLHATKEFGFLERTPALGSGSSLMPQKRNPDVAELVRGKAGRAVGDLVALLTALKGLPLAYDRDLQEDKAPVLDAVATATAVLDALVTLVPSLRYDHARLAAAAADPELGATELADRLVAVGVPFRAAHEAVGAAYRDADGVPTPDAILQRLPGAPPAARTALAAGSPSGGRSTHGGPGTAALAAQLDRARARLAERRTSLSSLDRTVGLVEELVHGEPE